VLVLVSALTLTACGQAGQTNPRLKSVAATGPQVEPTVPETPEPSTSPTKPPTVPPSNEPPPCPTGDFQWEIEVALAKIGNYGPITVDGVQAAEDCTTISNFQKRMGIGTWHGYQYGAERNTGQPGPTTRAVAERIAATDATQCPYSENAQACVDLTHQTFYIVQGGQVILGPTVTRTGMAGFSTWPGAHRIMDRAVRGWSNPYQVVLPYWQHFRLGQGLHETTTYIHDMWRGSHGCVNLLHEDAKTAFDLLHSGSTVYVYGVRPGTRPRGT
jgi:lipoprotein-anchoring transpeptidase ErfK/SrfK